MAQRTTLAIITLSYYNSNILATTVVRLVPPRQLPRVRGTWNQVNVVLRFLLDAVGTGTSSSFTIKEAFQHKLGLRIWRAAIVLQTVSPCWSVFSATRDQVAYIISQAHGLVMVIFRFPRGRLMKAVVPFLANATTTSRNLRTKKASVCVPKTMTRALSCSLGSGPPGVSSISLEIKPSKRNTRGGRSSQGDQLTKYTGIFVRNNLVHTKSNRFEHCRLHWKGTSQSRTLKTQNLRKTKCGAFVPMVINFPRLDQAPQRIEFPDLNPKEFCKDNKVFDDRNCRLLNANSDATIEAKSVMFLESIKIVLLCAVQYLWDYLKTFSMLFGKVLNKASEIKHDAAEYEDQGSEMKGTLSEKGPITGRDTQSEQTDDISTVGDIERSLEDGDTSYETAQHYQLCLSNNLGRCTSCIAIYDNKSRGCTVPCTEVHEISSTLQKHSCFSAGKKGSFNASGLNDNQENGANQGAPMQKLLHSPEKNSCILNVYIQDECKDGGSNFEGGFKFPGVCEPQDVTEASDSTSVRIMCGASSAGERGVHCKDTSLAITYCIAVTDDQRTIHQSSFEMAWIRIVTLMLRYAQKLCFPKGKLGIGSIKRLIVYEGNATLPCTEDYMENEMDEVFDNAINSARKNVSVTVNGSEKAGKIRGADGYNKRISDHYEEWLESRNQAADGKNVVDEVSEIANDDNEDFKNEPILGHLEIEDEDQLDAVLQDQQGVQQNGYVVQNPAHIIHVLPRNPMAHIPPLDQAPNANIILPAWLLAFQAHLANVQAQALQLPLELPRPNEEAPLNDHPASVNQENPNVGEDEDDEDVDDETDEHVGDGVDDYGPANEAVAALAPHPMVLPQAAQHPAQQPRSRGIRNRLRAAARSVKRKLTRRHHGLPMFYAGQREERPPLGLEEALPNPPIREIQAQNEDGQLEQRSARLFSQCFGFLYRRHHSQVQEYPLQNDQAPAFEEVAEVQAENAEVPAEVGEIQAEIADAQNEINAAMEEEVAQFGVAIEEPQAVQEFQQPIVVF